MRTRLRGGAAATRRRWIAWIAALWTMLALPAAALVERTVEKTIPVHGRVTLDVDVAAGSVNVVPTDDSEIRIRVRQAFDTESETVADEKMREVELTLEASRDGALVKARYRRAVRWTWEKWPPVALAFEIEAPRTCSLDVLTREGGITVGNFRGDVRLRAAGAPIFVGEIEGNVTAGSARGDISVTACAGDLTVEAEAGNILVGRVSGAAKLSGAGGMFELQTARGRVDVDADGADLKVGFAHPFTGTADLRVSGGEVAINLDPRTACTLDVRASRLGKVRVRELPLTFLEGAAGETRVKATLNGGGPAISVRASGGNVSLLGVPAGP